MLNRAEAGRRLSIAVLVVVMFGALSAAFDVGTDAISRQALAQRGQLLTAKLAGSSVLYGKIRRDKYTFVLPNRKKKLEKHTTYYECPVGVSSGAGLSAAPEASANSPSSQIGRPASAPTMPVWYLPDNPNVCRVAVSGQRPAITPGESQFAFLTAGVYLIVAGLAAFVLKNYAGAVPNN